ncbi:MAG TPA: hypothetical protein VJP80_06860 [Candidatus Saccharimonadales bacterium]|nr:hypothetical protein [Candidatus Saccharimonadales bacterium]
MLQLSGTLINRPVLSLRTSTTIAETLSPIINPDNLKIEGFYCQDYQSRRQLILLSQDIRDVLTQGLVVNDHEVLTEPEELVRLHRILQINFELLGKQVVTTTHDKIGKVSDFSTEIETMYIQKLYVTQSLLRNFTGGNLGVDRSQIVEINDKRIVINDLHQKVPVGARAVA